MVGVDVGGTFSTPGLGAYVRTEPRRWPNLSALWRFAANLAEVVAALPRGGRARSLGS